MPAGIQITDQYDALLTTTLRKYRKKLVNNIFGPTHFLKWLMRARGNGKDIGTFDTVDGGYKIVEHLMYGKNTTFDWMATGYSEIDTTPQEGLTIAEFAWREIAGTITISRKEKRQNSGEAQMISLLKAKTQQAEMSARDKFSQALFANITASPAAALDSVLLHVSSAASTTTTGGVSGATYSWWRNHLQSVGAYSTNLENYMRTAKNTLSKWGSGIDCIVCTQTALEYYESLGITLKRFPVVRNEKAELDLGFEVFKYKGADMFFDFDFATNTPATGETMLFINSQFMRLVMDKESNFIVTDFIEPDNQTAYVAKLLCMANLTISNRAAHGILYGISAS